MDVLTWFICAIALIGFMTYQRASLSTFTLSFTVLMIIGTFLNIISFFSWLLFAILVLPLNLTDFRKKYISQPLLTAFQKIMPEMSSTEKEALDAGTTWFEAELFRGCPDW